LEAIASNMGRMSRRLVIITPEQRRELTRLEAMGFTGYLIKPVRAQSLAAQLSSEGASPRHVHTTSPREGGTVPKPGGVKVLVAEDEDINALLARSVLTGLGYSAIVVANGAKALDAWLAANSGEEPYDFILMDVNMSEMDGLEATRRIRAVEAKHNGARTPIFALTANVQTDDCEACRNAGMDGVLLKPLDREQLRVALGARWPHSFAA
jgi:CheY-like chemotaxis protein